MSPLAEYARELHENDTRTCHRLLEPFDYPSRVERLGDIRAVIFDVYGTLINYRETIRDDKDKQTDLLIASFREVADQFGCARFLLEMDPNAKPEKTLFDLYHGLIALGREKADKNGRGRQDIKVEKIWGIILVMLMRRGYAPPGSLPSEPDELSRYFAYTYNFYSLGRELYSGAVETLLSLKKNHFSLGIVANAQFYTPVDLTLLIRDQSRGAVDDLNELFDPDLTFFSYEHEAAITSETRFRPLYDALYEYQILPGQTLYVGNDLLADIATAQNAGMKTALFTGDRESACLHEQNGKIVPDISFSLWDDLPQRLSFHSEEGAGSP